MGNDRVGDKRLNRVSILLECGGVSCAMAIFKYVQGFLPMGVDLEDNVMIVQ